MSYLFATLLSLLSCVVGTILIVYMGDNADRILRSPPKGFEDYDFGDGIRLRDIFWFYALSLTSMAVFFMACKNDVLVALVVALVYHVLTCRFSSYLRSAIGRFCLRGHQNISKWGFPNRRFFRRSHF